MRAHTILITAAGSAPAQAFIRGLRTQRQLSLTLVGVDGTARSAGLFDCERRYTVPMADDERFMEAIASICRRDEVDVVVPIGNFEQQAFADNAAALERSTTARVIANSPDAVALALDKRSSAEAVARHGVAVPAFYEPADVGAALLPVIVKPTTGAGSTGVSVVRELEHLGAALELAGAAPLVQDFIDGQEYTVDLVVAPDGEVLAAAPRIRIEVRAGQSYKGVTVDDPEIADAARTCVAALGITAQANVQLIRSTVDGRCYFVELNAKWAAAMGLTIGAGLNIPLLYVKLALGMEVEPQELTRRADMWLLRSWQDRVVPAADIDAVTPWETTYSTPRAL